MFRYFLAHASESTVFASRPVFSVSHDRRFTLWIFSTFLTFVYLLCCACLLSSIYLEWLPLSSHLCNVNYARDVFGLVANGNLR